MAAALTYGRVGPDEFVIDKVNDERMLKLARSVKVQIDIAIDKLAPRREEHRWNSTPKVGYGTYGLSIILEANLNTM